MKHILTTVYFLIIANTTFSQSFLEQLTYGGNLGFTTLTMTPYIGVGGAYRATSKLKVNLELNYAFRGTVDETAVELTPINSFLTPKKEVNLKTTAGSISLFLDIRRYLGRDREEPYKGFYVSLGIGAAMVPVKSSVTEQYDLTLYQKYEDQKETLFQPYMTGGLGYELLIKNSIICPYLTLAVPANNVNGQTITVDLPAFINIGVTYRMGSGLANISN